MRGLDGHRVAAALLGVLGVLAAAVPSGAMPASAEPVVSGRLFDAAGSPATGVRVGLDLRSSSSLVDADGTFSFPTSSGSSRPRIDVGTDWRRGRFVLVGSTVDTSHDVDLGTLTLPPVPEVALQVVNEQGDALPHAELGGDLDRRRSALLGHRLGDGQLVERITYLLDGRTDEDGRFVGLLPRGVGEGLTGFDVRYADGLGSFTAAAEDAVPLADGSYRITLEGATVAPAPDPPTDVRATAADGAVLLTWRSNPAAVPGRWHDVITQYPSGNETTLDPGRERRVVRLPNGSARSFTIASDDGVARSRDLVRTPVVTPQPLTVRARQPDGPPTSFLLHGASDTCVTRRRSSSSREAVRESAAPHGVPDVRRLGPGLRPRAGGPDPGLRRVAAADPGGGRVRLRPQGRDQRVPRQQPGAGRAPRCSTEPDRDVPSGQDVAGSVHGAGGADGRPAPTCRRGSGPAWCCATSRT